MPQSPLLLHPSACAAFYEPLARETVRVTLFAKLTFQLRPGASDVATYQEPLYAEEQRWDPRYPDRIDRAADVRPARGRIDVVLIAPLTGFPATPTRFVLGALDCVAPIPSTLPSSGGAGPFGPLAVATASCDGAAPMGQQVDTLEPNERLYLENVLVGSPTLTTTLPFPELRGVASTSSTSAATLRPTLVTVDAERGTASVTYRGELVHGERAALVYLSVAHGEAPPLALEPQPLSLQESFDEGAGPESSTLAGKRDAFGVAAKEEVTSSLDLEAMRPSSAAVPFGGARPVLPRGDEAPKRSPFIDLATLRAELDRANRGATRRTDLAAVTEAIVRAPIAEQLASERAAVALPSLSDRPTAVPERPPVPMDGLGPSQRSLSALLRQRVGPGTVAVELADWSPDDGEREADEQPQIPSQAVPLEFLWLDSRSHARIRKEEAWKVVLPEAPSRPPPKRGEPPPPPPSHAEVDSAERADAFAVLSRADERPLSLDPDSTRTAPDGSGALLQLVSGTLALPFDELELLKVTHAVATPLGNSDKGLREQLDRAASLLDHPLGASPEATLAMVQQVRDSWRAANRSLRPDFLVTQTERVLLGERRYQRRKLLGDEMVRGWFTSQDLQDGLPIYFPATLDKRLPLFPEFRVRAIVELVPKQDTYETRPLAMRVIAIGRVLDESASQAPAPTNTAARTTP